jgi:signal transduction histidine kinase
MMAGRLVIPIGLLAAAYYVAGRIGLELAYLDGAVAALWPPAGVGLAVLFRFGIGLWPGIVIGDLLLGDYSTPLATVLAQTFGNTVALVVAALLLRRLTAGRGGLERVTDVLAFVGCAMVAALISAAVGPLALRLGDVIGPGELGRVFRTWTLGDAAGVLVVAPVILTWTAHALPGVVSRARLLEGAGIVVLLVVLAEIAPQRDVPYIVFPVLLWAALRFGPRGAATAILVVCSITVWNTAHEEGPFVRESITDSLLATQLFIGLAAVTSLVLAAVTAELTRAEAAQRALAGEQAALRRVATLVAGDPDPGHVFERVTEEVGRLLGVPNAGIVRFEDDHTGTVVGSWSRTGAPHFTVGERVELDGQTVAAQVRGTGRAVAGLAAAAAPVRVGGRLWGALAAGSAEGDARTTGLEQRLCDFAELLAQALANADAYEQLAASRVRLVEAADAERRRLERNLHDGAQQRLVTLALQLRMVGTRIERDPAAAREQLEAAQQELAEGLEELRELARGIHPAVLTERGLGAALQALVARAPLHVEVEEVPEDRLAPPVEAAAYYVVAEAVTNATKYANASNVTVSIRSSNGTAQVTVTDDGVGGADPGRGTGLRGLADRLEALDGRLDIDSPAQRGTRLSATIPSP